jgi:regulatory protein
VSGAAGDLEKDALRLLKVRERTRKELESRLLRKGHEPEEVRRLLDRFVAAGWIDDERFARLFVEDRLRLRPRSYRLLDRELAARGVTVLIRRRVIAEARERLPEEALARSLARRGWSRLEHRGEGRRASLLRWLRNRGFSLSLAKAAVREVSSSGRGDAKETGLRPDGERLEGPEGAEEETNDIQRRSKDLS